MLAGNVVALLSPVVFIPILSYALPSPKYDWQSMKEIRKADDHDVADAAHVDLELVPSHQAHTADDEVKEQEMLQRAAKIARYMTLFMTIALLVLWPMPMYGSGYIFSKSFFTGWVSVGILWIFCSAGAVAIYPLWEGRKTSIGTIKAIYLDITGKKKPIHHMSEITGVAEPTGASTPTEEVSEKVPDKH